jgi:hypothetical protein
MRFVCISFYLRPSQRHTEITPISNTNIVYSEIVWPVTKLLECLIRPISNTNTVASEIRFFLLHYALTAFSFYFSYKVLKL